jgi:hypothetical protein
VYIELAMAFIPAARMQQPLRSRCVREYACDEPVVLALLGGAVTDVLAVA